MGALRQVVPIRGQTNAIDWLQVILRAARALRPAGLNCSMVVPLPSISAPLPVRDHTLPETLR